MRRTTIGASIALAMALAPVGASAADDGNADNMMMGSMVPHPSHIHTGVCPAPGDIIAPLSDVTVVDNDAQGAGSHIHVDIGVTTVNVALDDILAADHSIVVHQSADDLGTFIACGDIGGHFVGDSFLVGIGPVGDSGFSGIAWLTANADGTTGVNVSITQSGATGSNAMDAMDDDDMDDDDMDAMDDDDDMDDMDADDIDDMDDMDADAMDDDDMANGMDDTNADDMDDDDSGEMDDADDNDDMNDDDS